MGGGKSNLFGDLGWELFFFMGGANFLGALAWWKSFLIGKRPLFVFFQGGEGSTNYEPAMQARSAPQTIRGRSNVTFDPG